MRGGAELPVEEMERVSALFDVEKIGGAITGGLLGGKDITIGPMGEVGSLSEIQDLTVSRLQLGGGRSRKLKRHGRGRTSRKPRFRLNIRASIRLRKRR